MPTPATASLPAVSSASGPLTPSRLGSMTTTWEASVRYRDRTPPLDAHVPLRIRALSEEMAKDLLAHWCPELEVLAIDRYKPSPSDPA